MKRLVNYTIGSLLLIAISLLLTVSGCRATREVVDTKDLSYIYNPIKNSFNPVIGVFAESETSTTIAIKLYSQELFFNEANPTSEPIASLQISVRLFKIAGGMVLADTVKTNIEIRKITGKGEYIYNVRLDTDMGYDYLAEIAIFDNILLKGTQKYHYFSRSSNLDSPNFRVVEHDSNREVLTRILRKDEYVNLRYIPSSPDSLWVNFFPLEEFIPYPPYMMVPERSIPARPGRKVSVAYSPTLPIMFPNKGIYTLSVTDGTVEGYTFFNFGEEFPRMNSPESMIPPLAYIATQNELDSISSHPNTKIALDEFWVSIGGNIPKGRELIRIYYNRVLFSNHYFTSYIEGWRSDRGMIYIIYGPPDKVYRTADGERWGYAKPEVKSSWGTRYTVKEEYLWFSFRKRANRLSENDFVLNRNETVVSYWDVAIRTWRNGIVFRLDNPDDI